MRVSGKRVHLLLMVAVLMGATVSNAFQFGTADAAQITTRSLTLEANGANGGSAPNVAVNHKFTFNIPSSSSLGSIKFEYCTTPSVASCVLPTGVSTTAATLGGQTGPATGFTLNNSTQGAPYLTRTAATVTTGTASTFTLNSVTNPTAANYTFFVRITTYAATNATGSPIDAGSVAASTADPIVLTGTMPESIIFCTGATIGTTSGVPDCSTATPGTITFNQLFSPSDTATATSQMAASTNAGAGYAITVNGGTLTSGSNTIPALAATTAPTRGISQFGMNLRANTNAVAASFPGSSADIAPAANGTSLRGDVTADYDTPDSFRFGSGESIAESTNGGAGPTNSQIYTASYIVNVAGNQLAGTYTTTLTYICTATF